MSVRVSSVGRNASSLAMERAASAPTLLTNTFVLVRVCVCLDVGLFKLVATGATH